MSETKKATKKHHKNHRTSQKTSPPKEQQIDLFLFLFHTGGVLPTKKTHQDIKGLDRKPKIETKTNIQTKGPMI